MSSASSGVGGDAAIVAGPPRTLAQLHLRVERAHDRASVVRSRHEERWHDTPDWRFHRHILRVALYLKERAGLGTGERVAIVSTARPELLVTEWATVLQGGVSAVVDPARSGASLAEAMAKLAPKVVFVTGFADVARVLAAFGAGPRPERFVAFDARPEDGGEPRALTWSELLDLGGTLDTAERAQALRAIARQVPASAPAIADVATSAGRQGVVAPDFRTLTQAEAVDRIGVQRHDLSVRKGDVAYAGRRALSLRDRLSLFAFAGDGRTTTVIGGEGREAEEIAALRPRHVVAVPALGVVSGVQSKGGQQ